MFDLSHASIIKYSTGPNSATLYTEMSHSKMIETHFYHLYSIITGSKIIAGPQLKK